MGEPKEKIGIKEYTVMAIFLIGLKAGDDVPAMLFDSLKNAGWMIPIISGVIAILPLFLLLKIASKYPSMNAVDIFYHLFGKVFGFLILFLLWMVGFLYIVTDATIYTDIVSTMYFVRTPAYVLFAILIAISAYGAKKGLEQIGSVAWAAFPYVQVTLLFAIILSIGRGNADFLFPIFGTGEWETIKEGIKSVSIYVDFLYLFLLFPYVKSVKDYRKGTWIAFFLVLVNLSISLVGYVMLFDYHSVLYLNYPYHEAIRSVSLGFLTNVETLFFPFWLIAADIKLAIYLYINIFLFGQLFKIKHFEYIIPAFATLILFLGLIPESPIFTVFEMRNWIGSILSPAFFLIPIMMWMLSKFKGERKK